MLEIPQYGKHWYFLGYCSMGDTGHVGDITVWKTLVFFRILQYGRHWSCWRYHSMENTGIF